jgi:hypothetical protein
MFEAILKYTLRQDKFSSNAPAQPTTRGPAIVRQRAERPGPPERSQRQPTKVTRHNERNAPLRSFACCIKTGEQHSSTLLLDAG